MARIFVCYRRDDASGHAGRLRDALSAEFGAAAIFRDVETIGPGEDFVGAMSRAIASCAVFLAVIGRRWLDAAAPDGSRRLDHPDDHVRAEIAEALRRGVRVIPVLVQDARVPPAALLPDDVKALAARNAISLDDDSWEADVRRLAAAIRQVLQASGGAAGAGTAIPAPAGAGGRLLQFGRRHVVGAAGVAILAIILWPRGQTDEELPAGDAPPEAASVGATRDPAGPPAAASAAAEPRDGAPPAPVTLPEGGEVELNETVVEVLDAGVRGSVLALTVRLANRGRYDAILTSSAFRLAAGGETRAPRESITELVPAETAKEGAITFELPAGADRGQLQIAGSTERAEIPLDLTARRGATPAADRDARASGRTTFVLPIDGDARTWRFDELTCELRSATVRRYVNKQTLTLGIRAVNRGPYDASFGDGHFRLLHGGESIAPVSLLSTLVPREGTLDGDIVFDVPLAATRVEVRARYGDRVATVPLTLPPPAAALN